MINEDSTQFNRKFLNFIIKIIDDFCFDNKEIIDRKILLLSQEKRIKLLKPENHHRENQIVNNLFLFYPNIDKSSMRVNIELFYQDLSLSERLISATSLNVNTPLYYDHVMEVIFIFNSMSEYSFSWNQRKLQKPSKEVFLINDLLIPSFRILIDKQLSSFYNYLSFVDINATKKARNNILRIGWLIELNDKLHLQGFGENPKGLILPYRSDEPKGKAIFSVEKLENQKKLRKINEVIPNLKRTMERHIRDNNFKI